MGIPPATEQRFSRTVMTFASSSSSTVHSPPLLQPALPWLAILCFIGMTIGCIVTHSGSALNLLFPAGAVAVAALLYWRHPVMYVSFSLWLWFLSAEVRRLADFHGAGWTDPSPILLAPLLVTMLSGLTFFSHSRYLVSGLPFVLSAASVTYGFLLGLVLSPLQAVTLSFMGWVSPIFFGLYLFVHWREYPTFRQTLQRTLLWGVLVMGAYGVCQFFFAPPWDQFWMRQAYIHHGFNTAGIPEPLGIRVFSTSNSPQTFAAVMLTGLLLLLTTPSKLQPFSIGVGAITLLLSLARSAWLGLAVGLLVLIPSLKSSLQIRLIGGLLMLLLMIVPVVKMEPFSSIILPRVQSLNNSDDDSLQDRSIGYQRLLGQALSEVPGRGLGFTFQDSNIGSNDSGILSLWFSLGWLGALPYLLGVFLLLLSLFQTSVSRFDLFSSAARAIAVGAFSQIGLNQITAGQLSLCMWLCLGIGMAARQYHTWYYASQAQILSVSPGESADCCSVDMFSAETLSTDNLSTDSLSTENISSTAGDT